MKKLITAQPGARIAELRLAAGMDQRSLGVAAGLYRGAMKSAGPVPKPTPEESFAAGDLIASFESGERLPSAQQMSLIADALGVTVLDLTQQIVDLTPDEVTARQAEEAEAAAAALLPPPPDPQVELDAAIAAATTLLELKAALLGRVAGRPT